MSLVAYDSSDDSDESDQEQITPGSSESIQSFSKAITNPQSLRDDDALLTVQSTSRVEEPPISDEDDDFMATDHVHSGLTLPPPRNEGGVDQVTIAERQLSVLQGLPKPKAPVTDVGLIDVDEGELEDFVKQKSFEGAKEQPLLTGNITGKKRKLVQITVPELPVDSDEEEEINRKKQRPRDSTKGDGYCKELQACVEIPDEKYWVCDISLEFFTTDIYILASVEKKCGLFDVLPAPKNESLAKDIWKRAVPSTHVDPKEASMETETVTQKPVDKSSKAKMFVPASINRKSKQSSRSAFNLDTGIMMPKKMPKPNTSSKTATEGDNIGVSQETRQMPGALVSGVPDDSDEEDGDGSVNFFCLNAEEKATQEKEALSASSYVATASVSSLPAVTKQKETEEAPENPEPLTFSGTAGPELQDAPLQFKNPWNAYVGGGYSGSEGGSGTYGNAATYNYANVEDSEDMEVSEETNTQGGEEGMEGILQDKEFLKLQRKGKHGAEEINFIDVRQDDQISNVDVMKGLSEETGMMSHSKKKNKDMPSSQQKKKHQITYLAFRAKERELELKNQWADNRSTKKQTQAKYGF